VDDAAAFLRLRKVQGPVLVCGWIWGSTMALLFAQRHPELTRGVVVGGVWTNTSAEVRYYLGRGGTRALMPGLAEVFEAVAPGEATACDLHRAIRAGRGGTSLARAYGRAESLQALADTPMREPGLPAQGGEPGTPIDMASCADPLLRFAYIESEMMCRGQRGQWRLRLKFPKALAQVPLLVLQGRYDQVCDPQVAVRVARAWPGARKRLVPLNLGHGGHRGLTQDELARTGLDADLAPRIRQAFKLHYGDPGAMVAATLELMP
jgi:proline iminopeptidase